MKQIRFWTPRGENGFLSNFYQAYTVINETVYSTNEHFFQSQKFAGTQREIDIINLSSPAECAKEGKRRDRNHPLRKDWEEVKEDIMMQGLWYKFTQHELLKNKLLATGDAELIEASPYDYYWGAGRDGTGKNRLGYLLMNLRSELINA